MSLSEPGETEHADFVVTAQVAPSVSLIIPTFNRGALLADCLDTALEQRYPDFEVIIVDQSPTVHEKLESLMSAHGDLLRYHKLPAPNLPAARNEGVRRSRGSIVIFIDDDTLLPARFIQAHVQNYADPSVDAVAGPVLSAEGAFRSELPREITDRRLRPICGLWQYDRKIDVVHGPGGNHSFRRAVWSAAGGYDENYDGPGLREESDFFLRVHKAGHRIVYDPAAWLIHVPGVKPGGCWSDFDGIQSAGRFANHAYFVLKNYRPADWPFMAVNHFRGTILRRNMVRRPRAAGIASWRFARGWIKAMRLVRRLRHSG